MGGVGWGASGMQATVPAGRHTDGARDSTQPSAEQFFQIPGILSFLFLIKIKVFFERRGCSATLFGTIFNGLVEGVIFGSLRRPTVVLERPLCSRASGTTFFGGLTGLFIRSQSFLHCRSPITSTFGHSIASLMEFWVK